MLAGSKTSWGLTSAELKKAMERLPEGERWDVAAPQDMGLKPRDWRTIGGARNEGTPSFAMESLSDSPSSILNEPTPDLPSQFDWRKTKVGATVLPPVMAQGECGSCVAVAATAALEASLGIACKITGSPIRLSAQYLFSCGGGQCRSGWKLSEAVRFLSAKGVPDQACMPYQSKEGDDVACQAACRDVDTRKVQGIVAEQPTQGFIEISEIKRAIVKAPVLANMVLYEDLEHYKGGIYRHVAGNQLGSHAIVLVGWNDERQAWIARNSWGEAWGGRGYFEVAWNDTTLPARYTWVFDTSRAVVQGACSIKY